MFDFDVVPIDTMHPERVNTVVRVLCGDVWVYVFFENGGVFTLTE